MHIILPAGGYDSDAAGGHLPVTLLCSSAACCNGVVNNGFLLSAYDSDGNSVGSFLSLPSGAPRGRGRPPWGDARALGATAEARAGATADTRFPAPQASSARAAAPSRTPCRS